MHELKNEPGERGEDGTAHDHTAGLAPLPPAPQRKLQRQNKTLFYTYCVFRPSREKVFVPRHAAATKGREEKPSILVSMTA